MIALSQNELKGLLLKLRAGVAKQKLVAILQNSTQSGLLAIDLLSLLEESGDLVEKNGSVYLLWGQSQN